MVRPYVVFHRALASAVLRQCIRSLIELFRSGPLWISARVRSDRRKYLNRPVWSPVFACAGKTDPSSLLILSQTSAVKGLGLLRRLAFQCSRRLGGLSNGQGEFAGFGGASMRENAPDDAGQFIDQGTREDIVCLLYTSPSPRDRTRSRMPSSA